MGGGIVGPEVGFDLDDAPGEEFAALAADDEFTKQIGSDQAWVAVVEGAGDNSKARRFHVIAKCAKGALSRSVAEDFLEALGLSDRHIHTRTIAVVVSVRVNYEIQDLASADRNASQTKRLGWPTIRNRSCG